MFLIWTGELCTYLRIRIYLEFHKDYSKKKKWVQKNLTLESKANYSQEEAKSTWRMTTQIDLAVKSTFYFLLLQEESNPERSYK